jgi:hypothetical protein
MRAHPAIRHLVAAFVLLGLLATGSSVLAAESAAPPSGVIAVSATGVTRSVGAQTFPRKATLPVVDLSLSPSGRGYATLDVGGTITSYGDAARFGRQSFPRALAIPAAIALTPTGRGAYVGFIDGTVRALGDAAAVDGPAGGSSRLVPPLVDITLSPTGDGLWALRADGSVHALGGAADLPNAPSSGSPAVGIAAAPTDEGAWVARLNGSVAALGDAQGERGARGASEPRVADIASLGADGWVVVDLVGKVEVAGSSPVALPGAGTGFVAIDSLAASSTITGAGEGAPVSTKVIAPAAVLGTSGDPAETLVVSLPCYVTGGPTPLLVGDVLAASIGAETPAGLLRRVLGIGACSGGAVELTTEPATLPDALPEGELDFSDDLSDLELPDFEPTTEDGFISPNASARSALPRASGGLGARATAATAAAVGTFADPGRFTYGCPSDADEDGFEFKAKPSFSYDPEVIFEADWDGDDVHLRTGFGVQGDLSVELTATGSIVCDASFAILNGYSLGTKVFFVGPVPIVVQPRLTLLANLEGKAEGSISTTASVSGSISSTLQVDVVGGSATHSVASSNLVTGNLGTSFQAKAEATFALEPSVSFLLYGIVAPTAKLSAGAKATFEPCVNPNLKLEAPLTFRAKLEPSEWLADLLEPFENIDFSIENEFDFSGSPFLLQSAHIATSLPCEPTTTLPDATTGQPYSQQLAVQIPEGANDPVYSVAGGSMLPDGLTLSQTGLLSGEPTESGIYTFTVAVGHSLGSSSGIFELTVVEDSLRITTESLPGAELDEPYSVLLEANRPANALVWTITDGDLPGGLTLDPDGTLSGTPTDAGSFPITIRVQHPDGGEAAETAFSLTVTTEAGAVSGTETYAFWCVPGSEAGSEREEDAAMTLSSVVAQLQPNGTIAVLASGSMRRDRAEWSCSYTEGGASRGPSQGSSSFVADAQTTSAVIDPFDSFHDSEYERASFNFTGRRTSTTGPPEENYEGGMDVPVTIIRDADGTPVELDFNHSVVIFENIESRWTVTSSGRVPIAQP